MEEKDLALTAKVWNVVVLVVCQAKNWKSVNILHETYWIKPLIIL